MFGLKRDAVARGPDPQGEGSGPLANGHGGTGRRASSPALAPDGGPSSRLLTIGSLEKTYPNGTQALREVDLAIPTTPQFVSLLGPSGCGKSSLLRLIAGLERQSAGTIEWPGAPRDDRGRPRPEIGFVFQEATLIPWANVFDNVYMPLRIKGVKRAEARDRVLDALAKVHLEKFMQVYPRELSGGMKMRVSIARALVTRPKVLLMDEPFAALDEITRLKLNNDLLELWQATKLTVVFVTHSVYEAVYLSNRVVVMAANPGRIIADLPTDLPYPRDENLRMSSLYNEACRGVSTWLKRAMASVGDGQP